MRGWKRPGGDAFFPPFEDSFERVTIINDTPEFTIEHWRHKSLQEPAALGSSATPLK